MATHPNAATPAPIWDPDKYLDFADHRGRPFFELVSRIGARNPGNVLDLGCGPGNLTLALQQRWPDARIDAADSSPDMVAAAQARGVPARLLDVRDWTPDAGTGVVVSNAVLQWVPEHPRLLAEWMRGLPPDAWFAMQVPGNFTSPSHVSIAELAGEPHWRDRIPAAVLRGNLAVLEPVEYADIMSVEGISVDVWETTYVQQLTGADPVLEWVTGTALRPLRAILNDRDWQEFRAELAPILAAAYPRRDDGTTWFPFRRIFAVAHRN